MFNLFKAIRTLCLLCPVVSVAQTGNFTATFISPNAGIKPITISFSQPLYKFDNSYGYWFVNPHTGTRHFNIQPPPGYGGIIPVAFMQISEKDNDFDLYTMTSNDSDAVTLTKDSYAITAPKWISRNGDSNKPLHVHINTFTSSEISFTLSGVAQLQTNKGNGEDLGTGTIHGEAHFYREPKFLQSDPLPGCNCDPNIYPAVYDKENFVRSASSCENALSNKIFDAVQKCLLPLYTDISFKGTGAMSPGEINVSALPGTIDINVPVKERSYCTGSDYYRLTRFDAQKMYYSNTDGYGVRFVRGVSNDAMGLGNQTDNAARMQKQMKRMDTLTKLYLAKKITEAELNKEMKDLETSMSSGSPDIKKLEAENNLYLHIIINPAYATETEVKVGDKTKTQVLHEVKGAAFEIYSPLAKDNDGSWIDSRESIYLGKFTAPVMGKSGGGFDAEETKGIYPVNGNKLTIYNIIVKMDGGKDMIDRAIATMNINALLDLITKQ